MLKPDASVGVVIVNRDGGSFLQDCLRGLARQSLTPARVMLVDNGSSDGSTRRAAVEHPWLEVVELGRNAGFAAANNLAVRMLEGLTWVALLNPDACPEPDWLERLVAAARARPDCASFASRLVAADGRTLDGTGDAYSAAGLAWRRNHGRPAMGAALEAEEVFAACAAAALYRRDAFLAAGGFDEDYFCYVEDVDLAFRLRLAGHRCLYVPDAAARHVGSALSGRGSDFAVYHGHRNLVWTFVKDMPRLLLFAYLPLHLLLNLASIVWFALRGQARVILQAKRDALCGLPRVLRQRAAVQAGRRVSARQLRRSFTPGRPLVARRLWPRLAAGPRPLLTERPR